MRGSFLEFSLQVAFHLTGPLFFFNLQGEMSETSDGRRKEKRKGGKRQERRVKLLQLSFLGFRTRQAAKAAFGLKRNKTQENKLEHFLRSF